jgi:uncharacterized protein
MPLKSRALRILVGAVIAVIVLLVGIRLVVGFYTDILWYGEVGYLNTFWTRFWLGIGVRGVAALVGGAIVFLNLWLVVRRLGPVRVRRRYANIEIAEQVPRRYIMAIAVSIAVLGGWWLASLQYDDAAVLGAVSWLRRVQWGITDPLHGRDIAFYVYSLPFLRDLLAFATLVLLWSAVLVTLGHVLGGGIRLEENRVALAQPATLHLAALGGILLALFGARYWLSTYLLVVDGTGVARSLGYTDVHARLPAFRAMAALSVAAGVSLYYGARRRSLVPPVVGLGALLLGGLVLGALYPSLVQRFHVEPNELNREARYIGWHLEFTRRAYALEDIQRQPFPYRREADLDPDLVEPLLARLPLWDTEPLHRAFNEVQSLRPYYWFPDVDFDRYGPAGQEQQVVVGVREFQPEGLEPASRTWQSLHLNPLYIRGAGAVIAPARPTAEGRGTHELWVRNIEPIERHAQAPDELHLERSSIFFGETMEGYVVVIPGRDGQFTGQAGFDYPRGIPLSSFLRVLAFAWRFGDETLLFAREITPDSRLIFRRPVRERVRHIVPFLVWDNDPVAVVYEGRVVWLLDGYTISNSYPLARQTALGRVRTRYLRNSVKAAVDAVTGNVAFYAMDVDDPILATYGRIFPELFRPLETMPAGLQRHLRYPEAALLTQVEVLEEYHLERVEAFYAGQDVWQRPQQAAPRGGVRPYRPVRALMPVPGGAGLEYVSAMPYIARGRQNMTAILVARNDAPAYGDLTLVEFPRDQQVPGPGQVQAMIEQDPIIAPELSLLRQRGSAVEMGKLRVLPLDSSVLYVQPIFLSADENPIPEIWGIVVSDGREVALGTSLAGAVGRLDLAARLVGGVQVAEPDADRPPTTLPGMGTWPRQALDLLERADQRLRTGDWAGYGRVMDELRALLEELNTQSVPQEG